MFLYYDQFLCYYVFTVRHCVLGYTTTEKAVSLLRVHVLISKSSVAFFHVFDHYPEFILLHIRVFVAINERCEICTRLHATYVCEKISGCVTRVTEVILSSI